MSDKEVTINISVNGETVLETKRVITSDPLLLYDVENGIRFVIVKASDKEIELITKTVDEK